MLIIPERVIERVLSRWVPEGDCRISTYSTGSHGYAQVGWYDGHRTVMTLCHRVAWIAEHGPIPDGLTVDHGGHCRRRTCIFVGHLRLLTNVDNATDNGQGRKTHCPKGHPYSDHNTYRDRRGHRKCRACAGQKGMP